MSKTTTVLKKRPEMVELPSVPSILKISEVPSGISIMRINLPFTLTHLAHAHATNAFIYATTGKSPMTILGKENALLDEMKKKVTDMIVEKYPKLWKHVNLSIVAQIRYGSRSGSKSVFSPQYVSNVAELVETLEECGFSKVPLAFFQIPINKPAVWVSFERKAHYNGFIASQYGNKPYDAYTQQQLLRMIDDNSILQSLKCHVCETSVVTGKWSTCIIPKTASEEA